MPAPSSPHIPPSPRAHPQPSDRPARALEDAADAALLAPSVHNTQPWRIVLHGDRLELRADRSRQLTILDPTGRELVQSVGAALFNARVALAAAGRAVAVERLPARDDADLLAVVRPVDGAPDPVLTSLAPAIPRRRTNRRRFDDLPLPAERLQALTAGAAAEDTQLVPIVRAEHLRVLAGLTQEADGLQNADAAYRAELRRWTNRLPSDGEGVPASAVPHVDGLQHDAVPLRDFDTTGSGELPAETRSGVEQTLVLLATHDDEPYDWLRSGEALQRLLLDVTARGWAASPMTQVIELPHLRTQLRSAFGEVGHPQFVVRIGRAVTTARTPRRPRHTVVENSARQPEHTRQVVRSVPAGWPVSPPAAPSGRRPVSDGRGGTIWV
ncbi:Acg family FMN-binding oxidoreductase [Geodermatophilus ruber]|uniref:Nitroreductase family protein n=1 Tax=Geodermatophilus ruber TaxID=504800 RepID=A0A1I4E3W2_9ACTN|nr:nitroreductase [Geodermatophilus ruber]SFK99650.1 hypothetical protein SAMN04488085_105178 [Geodermatophilus ruber]